jgi:hypothetical protein
MRAIAANEGLRQLLETRFLPSPEPRALRAQRFLAGLSLIALEAPGRPRGVVVAEPMPWDVDPALIARVVEGLTDNPFLRPETVGDQFDRLEDDASEEDEETPLVRRLLGVGEPGQLAFSASDYTDARDRLTSFASVVGDDHPLIARGREALRVAPSSLLSEQQARAELALVRDGIRRVLDLVRATDKTVTLTSREAQIPVSFINETEQPVTVRMELASSKLLFPSGAQQEITLPPGNTTMQVPVEARATGTFTMNVALASRDGYLDLGDPARIRVRTTVFSGMGAWLTGGAATFLVLWWGNHIRRTRKERRAPAGGAPA